MNLFEINEEIRLAMAELFESVDEDTGEVLAEDIAEKLETLVITRDAKLENVALYLKEKQAEAEALKAEAKKLTDRARVASNAAERLKSYLDYSMSTAGLEKFESARAKFSYRKSTAVVVDDINALPEEYTKVDITADKVELKKALKNGDIIGAHLEERKSLVIK